MWVINLVWSLATLANKLVLGVALYFVYHLAPLLVSLATSSYPSPVRVSALGLPPMWGTWVLQLVQEGLHCQPARE